MEETHKEPSPEGLWEGIERAMKQNGTVKIPSKPNKILLWSKRIGAVATAVLALLLIRDHFLKEKNLVPIVQEIPAPNKSEKASVSSHERKLTAKKKSNKSFLLQESDVVFVTQILTDSLYKNNDSILMAQAKETEGTNENSQSGFDIAKKEEKNSHNSKKNDLGRANRYDLDTDLPMLLQRHKSAKWEIGLYASNIPSGSTKMYDGYGSLVRGEIPLDMEEGESRSERRGK
ncbi:MAG: hypothetical protein LBU84_05495 [Prevotella sp.]|jgi:hypothetical protein|nr:hypothetical protein [Prevotella sp.]